MSILTIILFLLGLALVVFGSDFLVDGSSSIARKSGISEFVIGLTIVGIGTSTPEMVVSFIGAIQGNTDISVGNIVGSNIFNTCLILGLTALILPMNITKENMRRDIPLNIGATILLIVFGLKKTLFGCGEDVISRIDGAIMLVLFALYLYFSFKNGKIHNAVEEEKKETDEKQLSVFVSILYVVGGLSALIFGGRLFVDNAVVIAKYLGWSDKFIAITVLAAGTSLPELATCIVAAVKKKGDLALGNIIGSNISNILLILGGAALINPLQLSNIKLFDLGFVLLAAFFLFLCNFMFKRKQIDRFEGVLLLVIEAVYMYFLISEL